MELRVLGCILMIRPNWVSSVQSWVGCRWPELQSLSTFMGVLHCALRVSWAGKGLCCPTLPPPLPQPVCFEMTV